MTSSLFSKTILSMVLSVLVLCSCSSPKTDSKSSVTQTPFPSPTEVPVDDDITEEDIINPKVVKENTYYKLVEGDDNKYYYYIYDENKLVVTEGGMYWKYPELTMISDSVVKFSCGHGTGPDCTETFYYDAKKDVLSRTFYAVFDEFGDRIVYFDGGTEKLTIRNIFDKTAYFYELTNFHNKLTQVGLPIEDASFSDNGKQLNVTYYTGDGYDEATETFPLE